MANTEIKLVAFFVAEDGEAVYSQQKQDLELTVAQIMSPLLQNSALNGIKQGKPLGSSGMTLIKSHMIVEVRNRFKGLDLVDQVPEELWMEVCKIVQEVVTKTIPKKKKWKKAK